MTYFTEFMFNQEVFPNILKQAKVIPIFKSGEKCLIKNYRPISLLPVFSKVIEKLIKVRILSFIYQHDVIYDRQSGFRKKHITMHLLLDIVTDCYDNINNGKFSCITSLDIKNAFDTVNFNILLDKSYLTEKKQYVCLAGIKLSLVNVDCGVPQGCVLGPVLFILYINDMVNALNTTPRLFADNSCILSNSKNPQDLQELGNSELRHLKPG